MDPSHALDALPRLRLCQLPTPIQRLSRLEAALGLASDAAPQLYIKRDDLTGLAFGGNKGRKLEFSLAEARQQDADVVLTCGGVQSNHCRQTAVAAAALGLEAHLFLRGGRPARLTGNLVPSELAGATFHFIGPGAGQTGPGSGVNLEDAMGRFAEELRSAGRRPYVIPTGASNPTGAMGYVDAAREIAEQQGELGVRFDWIVTASGSFGTQAGLLAGAALFGLSARVMGVAVSPTRDVEARRAEVARLATRTAERLAPGTQIEVDRVVFEADYAGPAYATPTQAGTEAIRLLARLEGIFLDPTYTGKAMAGLIDYVRAGRFAPGERVLFVHTGGNLALFA